LLEQFKKLVINRFIVRPIITRDLGDAPVGKDEILFTLFGNVLSVRWSVEAPADDVAVLITADRKLPGTPLKVSDSR